MPQDGIPSVSASEGRIGGDDFSIAKQYLGMVLEVGESRLPYLAMLSHIIKSATRMPIMVNPMDGFIFIEFNEHLLVPHPFEDSMHNDLVVGKRRAQTWRIPETEQNQVLLVLPILHLMQLHRTGLPLWSTGLPVMFCAEMMLFPVDKLSVWT